MRTAVNVLLFLAATILLASAARADAPPPGAVLKLFGGVSHKESIPDAGAALAIHRQRLAKLQQLTPISDTPVVNATPPKVAPPLAGQTSESSKGPIPEPPSRPAALPPAPYQLSFGVARPGPQVNPPVLNAEVARQHYTVEWFMLPRGMAGSWVKDGDLTTQVTDLRTGSVKYAGTWTENRLEAKWGHQMDGQGNVWHVNLLPSERDGSSAGKQVRFLTVAQQCERSNAAELITRTHYVVTESDNWTGQPVNTFQQESLNHYILPNASELVNSSTNRVFSYQGQPVRDGQLESKFRKTGNFTRVDFLGGINLQDSLNDYLQSLSSQSR